MAVFVSRNELLDRLLGAMVGVYGFLWNIPGVSGPLIVLVMDVAIGICLAASLKVIWRWKDQADPEDIVARIERRLVFYITLIITFAFFQGWPGRYLVTALYDVYDRPTITVHGTYASVLIPIIIGAVGLHLWRRSS